MSEVRVIKAFSNDTEWLVWVIPIHWFSLPEFQAAFGVQDPNDPMYDCWLVKPEHLPFLEKYVSNPHGWNFEAESYFVECDAA